ncbi:MAG: hypothetical protein HZA52_12850, partial [Planctomycetes bacterium]|nr:hypothetical protein [Planctomycetota bacterium]
LFVLGLALLQAPTASAPAAGSSTPGPMMQAPTIATPGAQAAGASSPSPSGVAPAAEEPAPPPVVLPAFDGLADGLTELRFAVGEGQHDVAVGLADALLAPNAWSRARTAVEAEHAWLRRGFDAVEPGVAWLGLGGPTSKARAEIHYAAGVAEDRGGNAAAAQTRFQTALALAGPGSLRLDAGYNVGAIALGLAERLREAQKQAPAAGAQGAPSTQGSGLPGGEPLDRLESAYRAAKQELVLRLRADWHDEDTRANLELIQRRLREIEKQREEQKQQQQQQQQQKQDSKQDSKEQDPNQKDPEKSDAQQDPKDQKDQPSSSNEDRKDPSEQKDPKEGEQKDAEQQDPTKSDQQSSEQQPDPKDAKDAQQAPAKPEERVMTREEILRLLSQLEEIEKEGQAVRARLQRSRRAGAEKDW